MPELPVTFDDVRHAAAVVDAHVRRTPVFSCASLGEGVWLKAELLQRTGAFKVRGAFSRIAELTDAERARGIVTCSAGNHAAAVALAGRELGTNALVMMPRNASPPKVAATRAYGGTADLESADAAEAFARMDAEAEATGRVIVHPFNDPAVIAGQGTLGIELCEQVGDITQVVVPVGGGGLIAGVATAVKALAPGARVIGVEPAVIATLAASIAAGDPVPRPRTATLADALAPPAIGVAPLAVLTALLDEVVTVSEDELADGFRFLYARAKLAVEPAAAAPAAALLAGAIDPVPGTVLVLSGGNVAPEVAARILADAPSG
jgi:threonine dehydratase